MSIDKDKLVEALKEAKRWAQKAAIEAQDGGTCNFDCCMVQLPRLRAGTVAKIAADAGVDMMRWTTKGAGVWSVTGWNTGQGHSQTAGAEAARDALKYHGFTSFCHYAMD